MVQKRPFYDENFYSISSKHPKNVEHGDQLVSFSEFVPVEVTSVTPYPSGERGPTETTEDDERIVSDITTTPVSAERDMETTVPGSSFISSWTTNSEEASSPQLPVHTSFTLEYFSPDHPIRTASHYEDAYSLLWRYPPRKAVLVGSNHQADIPVWSPPVSKNTSKSASKSEAFFGDKDENRLMGTCVVAMPDLELADGVGNVGTYCECLDDGSVRCVRQHVMEARDKLKRILGHKTFMELGFCDMGEQVAEKWSEEEEQLFHEIVFANPVSLGKNFWDHLYVAFPSRSKKDVVSYYFNVFMLQRRAEQNRCNSMNIDSDNDELLERDGYGDKELEMIEEDDDSIVESPAPQDDCAHNQSHKDYLDVYNEGATDETYDSDEDFEFVCDRGIINVSEARGRKLPDTCCSSPASLFHDRLPWEQEIQNDSCSSFDTGDSSQGTLVKAEEDYHWPSGYNELSGGRGEEYLCDAKVWDAGYMAGAKSGVDFLPTCSVIEEVCGADKSLS